MEGRGRRTRGAQANQTHKRTQETQDNPIHKRTQETQSRQLHKQYSQEELELQKEMEKRFDELFEFLDDDEWE